MTVTALVVSVVVVAVFVGLVAAALEEIRRRD